MSEEETITSPSNRSRPWGLSDDELTFYLPTIFAVAKLGQDLSIPEPYHTDFLNEVVESIRVISTKMADKIKLDTAKPYPTYPRDQEDLAGPSTSNFSQLR